MLFGICLSQSRAKTWTVDHKLTDPQWTGYKPKVGYMPYLFKVGELHATIAPKFPRKMIIAHIFYDLGLQLCSYTDMKIWQKSTVEK